MLYPSLHIVGGLIYYLFSSRSNCDCGCGQNCAQDCGNPNNSVRFCKDCSDSESRKSKETEDVTDDAKEVKESVTQPRNVSVTPRTTPRPKNQRTKIIVVTVVTVSITAGVSSPLIVRAFFRPPMPSFALPDINVNSFDISTPNVIRANFRVTISSRNTNSIIRFYFDRLRIYITYRDQQITSSTALPPGHNQTDAWTADVSGTPVTLEPNKAIALCQEQATTGSVRVTIKIVGRMRWKFWFFPFVKHKFSVTCSASIPVGSQQTSIVVQKCRVRL